MYKRIKKNNLDGDKEKKMRDITINQVIENIKVIKDFFFEKYKTKCVKSKELADLLDIDVIERSLEKTSQMLGKKVYGILIKIPEQNPKIYIEEKLSNSQKEITTMHEIGHLILHWGVDAKYINKEKVEVAFRTDLDFNEELNSETQANIFATHLMFDYDNIENVKPENNEELMFKSLYEKYKKVFTIIVIKQRMG